MEDYKQFYEWVDKNVDKLFLDGFNVVQLKSFIISPYDNEPCYRVVTYNYSIETGASFTYSEVPVIVGIVPIETLPNYDRVFKNWTMNIKRIGITDDGKSNNK